MVKKGKASKFRGKVSANSHKQKTTGASYGHLNLPRGVNIFKETAGGKAFLDIMPYAVTEPAHPDRDDENGVAVPGELWYKRPYKLHRNVGVSKDTVVCPTSVNKKCPICEYRAKLLKENASEKEHKPLRPSQRNLYTVIPLGMKDYEEEPHIWDISQFCFQDMLNEEVEEDTNNEVFPDLEEGLSLRLRFTKESIEKTEFAKISRIDFVERDSVYDEEILEQIPSLDDVLAIPSYSALENKFFELGDAEDDDDTGDDDAEDDAPSKKRSKKTAKPTKKKKVVEEEDDDTEDDDDDYAGLEEMSDDEAEDGDDEEEDEEAPEPPKKKQKPSNKTPPSKKKGGSKKGGKECPYGHTFGVDCETSEDCDECDLWDQCLEEKEKDD